MWAGQALESAPAHRIVLVQWLSLPVTPRVGIPVTNAGKDAIELPNTFHFSAIAIPEAKREKCSMVRKRREGWSGNGWKSSSTTLSGSHQRSGR